MKNRVQVSDDLCLFFFIYPSSMSYGDYMLSSCPEEEKIIKYYTGVKGVPGR